MEQLRFDYLKPFLLEMKFEDCELSSSSFLALDLNGTSFKNCNLKKCDFAECNLQKAEFQNCDLDMAIFENTDLQEANLISALNYTIDPDSNKIKGAKFHTQGLEGLLKKYQIVIENDQ